MIIRFLFIFSFLFCAKTQVFSGDMLPYNYFPNIGIDSVITGLQSKNDKSIQDKIYTSRLLANAYIRKGVYKVAEAELLETIESLTSKTSEETKGLLYMELAEAYKFDTQFGSAIKYYLMGIDLFKQHGLWSLYCKGHVSIAEYYRKIGDFKKGLQYLNTSIDIYTSRKLTAEKIYFRALNRKAAIFNEIDELEASIKISEELISLSLNVSNKGMEADARKELGYSFMNQKKFELANEQFILAENIYREKGDLLSAVSALNNRAMSSSRAGYPLDYSVGIQKKIIREVEENELDYPLEYVYGILSATYVDKKDWDSAIIFQDMYFFSKLQTEHGKFKNTVYEIEASYKNDKIINEKEKVEKELEGEQKRGELEKEKTFITLVLLLLVVLLSIVLLRMYRLKRKVNKSLVSEVKTKHLLLKEVNHRVKNNMQMVSSLLTLQFARVESKEAKDALKEGIARVNALGLAHQELYKNDDFTYIQIEEYMTLIANSLCIKTKIQINIDIKEGFKMHIEKAQALGFIVNELITNSIKYAWKEIKDTSSIQIKISETEGDILFTYRDNGIGYPDNYNSKETRSLGTSLIHSFIERQLNGAYTYYTQSGAVVEIKYKLSDVL